MIPPLQAVRRILWGNVYLDSKKVPVIKRSYPYDKTPCITIDDSGGSKFVERYITQEEYPLPNTHPQFDIEHPFKKAPQQVKREVYETSLNINVWCDTEDEREDLNKQIQDLFDKVQSDHYMFCERYDDTQCCYIGNTCLALHFREHNRGVKEQCPNPKVYGYKNIFTKYNLIRASFHLNQPFSLDDTATKGEVLRSVLRLDTGYYVDYIIGGHTFNNINPKIMRKQLS